MVSDIQKLIVAEALTWVGTPWRKEMAVKSVGADCSHFIGGVLLSCGVISRIPTKPYHYGFWTDPTADPITEGIVEALDLMPDSLEALSIPWERPQPGDLLCFALLENDKRPTHVGLVHEDLGHSLMMVHAREPAGGRAGKVELTRCPPHWRLRIVEAWRIIKAVEVE